MTSPTGNGATTTTEIAEWRDRTRIFLRPIAAPSILVACSASPGRPSSSPPISRAGSVTRTRRGTSSPFAAAFGGIAQFAAAMWAYIARDAVAAAMHGTWGAFWIGFGVLFLLVSTGTLTLTGESAFDSFGFWFFALAVITAFGVVAATFESLALTAVLALLAVGAAFLGIGYNVESPPTAGEGWLLAGGWVLIGSAIVATYTAGPMMLEAAAGRVVLPLGKYHKKANIPGSEITSAIELERGEVGVRQGQ